MKKQTGGILCAMVILIGIPFAVKASEASGSGDTSIKSYGSIFYEDATGAVKICAEDIALLQKKLASVPDEIFDPARYSHTHIWEYLDITDQNHTKHCDGCGSVYDIINPHNTAETKTCTISFNGREYPGYEKSCECGYQWKEELEHTLVYIQKDEKCHSVSCALAGTSYCAGTEAVYDVPHWMALHSTDESHHQSVCGGCGYIGDTEPCEFDILDDTNAEEIRKYCACGNFITGSQTQTEDSDLIVTEPETTDTEIETEAGEEQEQQTEPEETEEETAASDPDGTPGASVSGNDCMEDERSNMTEQVIRESVQREGANKS